MTETNPPPNPSQRAVQRPRDNRRAGRLITLLIPFWAAVLVTVGYIYNTKLQQTWPLGKEIVKSWEELSGVSSGPGQGLAIRKSSPQRELRNGVDIFIFQGRIENITDQTVPLPAIHLDVLDAANKTLHTQIQSLDKAELGPGETVPYKIEIENPSHKSRTANIRFISKDDATQFQGEPHAQ